MKRNAFVVKAIFRAKDAGFLGAVRGAESWWALPIFCFPGMLTEDVSPIGFWGFLYCFFLYVCHLDLKKIFFF